MATVRMPALEAVATRALVEEIRRRVQAKSMPGRMACDIHLRPDGHIGVEEMPLVVDAMPKTSIISSVDYFDMGVTPPAKPETFGARIVKALEPETPAHAMTLRAELYPVLKDMADALDRLTEKR